MVDFDFLIYGSSAVYTLYSGGDQPRGFTIQKPGYYEDIIVHYWDEQNRIMQTRTYFMPGPILVYSRSIQIESKKVPEGTTLALQVTVNGLVPDPSQYQNYWAVYSGQQPFHPPLPQRYIQIQGPNASNTESPRPQPPESVVVTTEPGGNVGILIAGSNMFTSGTWFELGQNQQGPNGVTQGQYFLFLYP